MIDTMNKFMVGKAGENVVMLMPPIRPMTKDEALTLAAYLVLIANDDHRYQEIMIAVMNT